MWGFITTIFTNRIVISVILSYFVTSVIKVFFNYLAHDEWDLMVFFRTGGMPSSHTATVSAMTASIYFLEGFSNLFFISLIISSVIVSDAVGIRRSAGKQAHVLNKMVEEFKYFKKFRTKRLYELLGHTPKQAIAGLILGILIAKLVFMF